MSPNAYPDVTPMNSDGAKMPPDPPMPRLVAAIFRRRQQEQAQGDPPGGGPGPFRAAPPQPVPQILDQVDDLAEGQPD